MLGLFLVRLENFIGTVEEINMEKKKVRVSVSMFGRETPVELELFRFKNNLKLTLIINFYNINSKCTHRYLRILGGG